MNNTNQKNIKITTKAKKSWISAIMFMFFALIPSLIIFGHIYVAWTTYSLSQELKNEGIKTKAIISQVYYEMKEDKKKRKTYTYYSEWLINKKDTIKKQLMDSTTYLKFQQRLGEEVEITHLKDNSAIFMLKSEIQQSASLYEMINFYLILPMLVMFLICIVGIFISLGMLNIGDSAPTATLP
ncbi:MAG: hypothetical protein EAZ55_08600 [Cytophagales bacterium]|nr:MAG: hypothetical protein EAZ55_08600 [Cytophagales bacterium]